MDVLQAIVLGVVQGLTEFLPISSSAHLLIVPKLAGWPDPGAAFTAVIQLGTMLAVVIFFWRDIVRILWTWARSLWTPELRGHLDARMAGTSASARSRSASPACSSRTRSRARRATCG